MKTVKQLLIEFTLLQTNSRIKRLEEIAAPQIILDSLYKKVDTINKEGIQYPGEQRGWMKPFFNREVQSQPLLIKDGDEVIGLALMIGYDERNLDVRDYITYRYDPYYKKFEFSHTVIPAFRAVKSSGPYPRKVVNKNYQLSLSAELTHIL